MSLLCLYSNSSKCFYVLFSMTKHIFLTLPHVFYFVGYFTVTVKKKHKHKNIDTMFAESEKKKWRKKPREKKLSLEETMMTSGINEIEFVAVVFECWSTCRKHHHTLLIHWANNQSHIAMCYVWVWYYEISHESLRFQSLILSLSCTFNGQIV